MIGRSVDHEKDFKRMIIVLKIMAVLGFILSSLGVAALLIRFVG